MIEDQRTLEDRVRDNVEQNYLSEKELENRDDRYGVIERYIDRMSNSELLRQISAQLADGALQS